MWCLWFKKNSRIERDRGDFKKATTKMTTVETSSTASFNCVVMKIIRHATKRQLLPFTTTTNNKTSFKIMICNSDKPPRSKKMKESGREKIGDVFSLKNYVITLLNVVRCSSSSSPTSKGAHQLDIIALPRVLSK